MIAIIVDQREPDYIKAQFPDAPTALLDAGDLWVACEDDSILLIERKTSEDLLQSIRDGRLFEQIARLVSQRLDQLASGKPQTYYPYLVITGELRPDRFGNAWVGRETKWSWHSVQGTLLTVQEMGCYVLYLPSDTEYSKGVEMLAKRERKAVIDILPQRIPSIVDNKTAFLMSLPGIGLERARMILDWAGSPAYALCGITDLSVICPALGEITRKNIRSFLGLAEQQTLEFVFTDEGKEILVIKEEQHV